MHVLSSATGYVRDKEREKKKTFPEFIGSGSTLIEFNF